MAPRADRPGLFGWGFATVFCLVPAGVLLGISAGIQSELDRSLGRLDHLDALPASERLVTGRVQPAAGQPLLTAPSTGRACVAWEASAGVSWSEHNDSAKRWEQRSKALRRSRAALRMVVTDERAGVVATLDGARVELDVEPVRRIEPAVPAWARGFEEVGADVIDERDTSYWSSEASLAPGAPVTFFARSTDPVMPLAGEDTLRVFVGTPDAWRAALEARAPGAVWTRRIGLVFTALTALFALGLVRAIVLRRRS